MSAINTDQLTYNELAVKLKELTPVVEKFLMMY